MRASIAFIAASVIAVMGQGRAEAACQNVIELFPDATFTGSKCTTPTSTGSTVLRQGRHQYHQDGAILSGKIKVDNYAAGKYTLSKGGNLTAPMFKGTLRAAHTNTSQSPSSVEERTGVEYRPDGTFQGMVRTERFSPTATMITKDGVLNLVGFKGRLLLFETNNTAQAPLAVEERVGVTTLADGVLTGTIRTEKHNQSMIMKTIDGTVDSLKFKGRLLSGETTNQGQSPISQEERIGYHWLPEGMASGAIITTKYTPTMIYTSQELNIQSPSFKGRLLAFHTNNQAQTPTMTSEWTGDWPVANKLYRGTLRVELANGQYTVMDGRRLVQ